MSIPCGMPEKVLWNLELLTLISHELRNELMSRNAFPENFLDIALKSDDLGAMSKAFFDHIILLQYSYIH